MNVNFSLLFLLLLRIIEASLASASADTGLGMGLRLEYLLIGLVCERMGERMPGQQRGLQSTDHREPVKVFEQGRSL